MHFELKRIAGACGAHDHLFACTVLEEIHHAGAVDKNGYHGAMGQTDILDLNSKSL